MIERLNRRWLIYGSLASGFLLSFTASRLLIPFDIRKMALLSIITLLVAMYLFDIEFFRKPVTIWDDGVILGFFHYVIKFETLTWLSLFAFLDLRHWVYAVMVITMTLALIGNDYGKTIYHCSFFNPYFKDFRSIQRNLIIIAGITGLLNYVNTVSPSYDSFTYWFYTGMSLLAITCFVIELTVTLRKMNTLCLLNKSDHQTGLKRYLVEYTIDKSFAKERCRFGDVVFERLAIPDCVELRLNWKNGSVVLCWRIGTIFEKLQRYVKESNTRMRVRFIEQPLPGMEDPQEQAEAAVVNDSYHPKAWFLGWYETMIQEFPGYKVMMSIVNTLITKDQELQMINLEVVELPQPAI